MHLRFPRNRKVPFCVRNPHLSKFSPLTSCPRRSNRFWLHYTGVGRKRMLENGTNRLSIPPRRNTAVLRTSRGIIFSQFEFSNITTASFAPAESSWSIGPVFRDRLPRSDSHAKPEQPARYRHRRQQRPRPGRGRSPGGTRRQSRDGGAQRMLWIMASYANGVAAELALGIRFQALVPQQMTAAGGVGRAGSEFYSRRKGISAEQFLGGFGKTLSAQDFGEHVVSILTEPRYEEAPAFGIKGDHGIVALGA